MKLVHVTTRSQWRQWLARHQDQEPSGIWLVFHKNTTGKPTLKYEEAVEEALCYGWIDSVIKRIDDRQYCRKFTPRRDASQWSILNIQRAEKLIREGRMTQSGLAKIEAARRLGNWVKVPRPPIDLAASRGLAEALAGNRQAQAGFEKLATGCQKRYLEWIGSAKRPETRARRINECLALLAKGQSLGLK